MNELLMAQGGDLAAASSFDAVDQFLGLYNYWIVIVLMMIGFYIVIARENFIKTIIGLNIFQVSVILLYITMGKVNGGTAPIVPPEIAAKYAAEHHHHADDAHILHPSNAPGHSQNHGPDVNQKSESHEAPLELELTPPAEKDSSDSASKKHTLKDTEHQEGKHEPEHPERNHSNKHSLDYAAKKALGVEVDTSDIIFSNPLPSVLMLTAIVVGIATTALALALTVRIREDYGTIEENEVLELDRKS